MDMKHAKMPEPCLAFNWVLWTLLTYSSVHRPTVF